MKKIIFIILCFTINIHSSQSIEDILKNNKTLIDISLVEPSIVVDLKYSTKDNFLHLDVYGSLNRCFLLKHVANKLKIAQQYLKQYNKNLTLVVYDCTRPLKIQKKMWEIVKNTNDKKYVANPYTKVGSIHNYGCAVDLSILENNKSLDMGGKFDYFNKISQPKYEFEFFKRNKLTLKQWSNRLLLRQVMLKSSFIPISNEWWHFNCTTSKKVYKLYSKI